MTILQNDAVFVGEITKIFLKSTILLRIFFQITQKFCIFVGKLTFCKQKKQIIQDYEIFNFKHSS